MRWKRTRERCSTACARASATWRGGRATQRAGLAAHDFTPFTYAMETHQGTLLDSVRSGLAYVAGAAGYVAVPVLLAALAAWPSFSTLRDTVWPKTPERRPGVVACAPP